MLKEAPRVWLETLKNHIRHGCPTGNKGKQIMETKENFFMSLKIIEDCKQELQ